MSLLDSLTGTREFRVFVPDITMAEAMKNEPYVLRIILPPNYSFVQVLKIENPLAGIVSMLGDAGKIAYAFMVEPSQDTPKRVYITSVFGDNHFPWHANDGDPTPVLADTLGVTTHSGVPIFHLRSDVAPENYEQFEKEVAAATYRIVDAVPYTQNKQLIDMYKAYSKDLMEQKEKADGAG